MKKPSCEIARPTKAYIASVLALRSPTPRQPNRGVYRKPTLRSAGMRTSAWATTAIVAEPALLLLDEPASGLSEEEMAELGDFILDASRRMGIMLVEHHMDLVMRVCDEITVLDFGKVIAHGTPEHIREDPAVLAAYLGDEVRHETTPDPATPDQTTPQGGAHRA